MINTFNMIATAEFVPSARTSAIAQFTTEAAKEDAALEMVHDHHIDINIARQIIELLKSVKVTFVRRAGEIRARIQMIDIPEAIRAAMARVAIANKTSVEIALAA